MKADQIIRIDLTHASLDIEGQRAELSEQEARRLLAELKRIFPEPGSPMIPGRGWTPSDFPCVWPSMGTTYIPPHISTADDTTTPKP